MVKATVKTTSNSEEEEDSSMMGEYFQKYKEYKNKFGEKMFLLWQCGSFFEVYGIKKNDFQALDSLTNTASNYFLLQTIIP